MKAWAMTGYGPVDWRMRLIDLPRPETGRGQVLIRMRYASLNPMDYRIIEGQLKRVLRYRMPQPLGFDVAGVVEEAAPGSGFTAGQRVFARASREEIGTLADLVLLNAAHVAAMPQALSFEQAAALPLVALTTLQALEERGRARPGMSVLIQGGSGGLGTFAVQYARHLGLDVTATCASHNVDLVKRLGAQTVIAYDREDWRSPGRFYDIVLDTLGGHATLDSFRVVNPGGVVVSVAGPPDRDFAGSVEAGVSGHLAIWLRNRRVYAEAARARAGYFRFLTESSGPYLARIGELVAEGYLHPVIDRIFDFEEAAAAMAYLKAGRSRGKVLVRQRAA